MPDSTAILSPPRVDVAAPARRPRVVVVGAGFGGLAAAKALDGAEVDVMVIDRHNYHLFQPLLYQVATAGLSPSDIAQPILAIVGRQSNTTVLLARVTAIDVAMRAVICGERRIPYDRLIVATGARHAYFGKDEWEAHAPGLKKIEDATAIRRRVLVAFEQAEQEENPVARRKLLNFVIIGGGPTGVELAGAVVELARRALAADFRHIDPRDARVVLVEGNERVLMQFPPALSAKARAQLEALGVEVRTGKPVELVDADGAVIAGERIAAATVIWAAGVAASPAAKWLGAAMDRAGRVKVGPDLTLPGHPEVHVIGDTAHALDAAGKQLPGVAPVAKQQGRYAARAILARLAGRPVPEFRYVDWGNMATIGRKAAVADIRGFHLSGFPAWVLWSLAHVWFLVGFRSRILVALNWLWAYLTYQRGARLITDHMN